MKLHRTPDGTVWIRGEDDATVWSGTVEEFAADRGRALPALPEGMTSFIYDTDAKVMTYYDRKGNAFPVEGEHVCTFSIATCEAGEAMAEKKASRVEEQKLALRAVRQR